MQEATKHQGSKCKVKIIAIDEKTIEKLANKFPFYTKTKIPGGLYNNNKKDLHICVFVNITRTVLFLLIKNGMATVGKSLYIRALVGTIQW